MTAEHRRAELESELLLLFKRGIEGGRSNTDGSSSPACITDAQFNDLALRIFRHQWEGSPVLSTFWRQRGAAPEAIDHWTQIPGVPTAAFKEAALCTFPPDRSAAIFETSGTTASDRPGRHYLRTLSLYEASLLPTFETFVLPEQQRMRMLNLGPNAESMPHSSLGHMLSKVLERWGGPGSRHVQGAAGPDLEGFRRALRDAETQGEPVCLLGTAFGFIHWLDKYPEGRFRLAPGSRLMDTGGTKGRVREMDSATLYAAFQQAYSLRAEYIVNEYGMTELSSQYYDTVLRAGLDTGHPRPKRGPPWLRPLVVDPETLRPLPEGEIWLILHFDLANLDSVLAVQTDDLGRVTPHGLQLLGRATGAKARGCSLAAEELMQTRR
jgi:hypothetical protein